MKRPATPPASTVLFVLFLLAAAVILLLSGCVVTAGLSYLSPRGNTYSVTTDGRTVHLGAQIGDGKTIHEPQR